MGWFIAYVCAYVQLVNYYATKYCLNQGVHAAAAATDDDDDNDDDDDDDDDDDVSPHILCCSINILSRILRQAQFVDS